MPTVSTSAALREEIQKALSGDTITLTGSTNVSPFSVTTLGKVASFEPFPATPATNYVIDGPGQFLSNTRIYQLNIDAKNDPSTVAYAPGTVQGASGNRLTLNYLSGGAADGTALFRAISGTYNFNWLNFTGQHTGWNGNGGVYFSLTTSTPTPAISVSLTLSNSLISVTGQQPGSFFPGSSSEINGGSAFIQSANNTGNVSLLNNQFDESGYLSAFNFFNTAGSLGTYTITGNTFFRTSDVGVIRRRGSALRSANAVLNGNTWNDGTYLHLFNAINQVRFQGTNTFNTTAAGYGIRAEAPVSGSAQVLTGATLRFTGAGLPIYYRNAASGVFTILAPTSSVPPQGIEIYSTFFQQATAGGQANDTIVSVSGRRLWAHGDDGNDNIQGSNHSGGDFILGGNGNDSIEGFAGPDTISGGVGDDSLHGGTGNDSVSGGTGVDTLIGEAGNDILYGEAGDDVIDAGSGDDSVLGEAGDDVINAGSGDDSVLGGTGSDYVDGGDDQDSIYGGDQSDTLLGGTGDDLIYGGSNSSTTVIDEIIDGGEGSDTIYGESGQDSLIGVLGNDFIFAGDEGDFVDAGDEIDVVSGDAGDDTIIGGTSPDTLTGGTGTNLFIQDVFDSSDGFYTGGVFNVGGLIDYFSGLDTITDFKPGLAGDILDLSISSAPITAVGVNSNALAANVNYYLPGTFDSGFSQFTIGTGPDTLLVQSGAGGSFNSNFSSILLLNVDSSTSPPNINLI